MSLIIALIILLTTYAYFRSSLIHFNGTIDKDYFPAFGNFIGSITGVFLSIGSIVLIFYTYQSQQKQSLLTKELIDRQISLSVKPEIFVKDYFHEQIKSTDKKFLSIDKIVPIGLQIVNLNIINVGIEVAQYIEYSFKYNVSEIVDYLTNKIKKPLIRIEYKPSELFAEIILLKDGTKIGLNVLYATRKNKKDYLMPYKLNSDSFEIPFPSFYCFAYYYATLDNVDGKEDLEYFPKCHLEISYADLEAKKHLKKFNIEIEFMVVAPSEPEIDIPYKILITESNKQE